MAILRSAFGNDPSVKLVQAACGATFSSTASIRLSDIDLFASLSDEWISAVSKSGRSGSAVWSKEQPCDVITLDSLICSYGIPSFIKIDVEGYEFNVLKGLSRSVPGLSFEFTPERLDAAHDCLDYLRVLGFTQFNLSIADSFEYLLDQWVSADQMIATLQRYRGDTVTFGDIYALCDKVSA